MSGDQVVRHGTPGEPEMPSDEAESLEPIHAHLEAMLGEVENVFHELVSDMAHIDVLHVGASAKRPFQTLVTSGMSDLPMTVPPDTQSPRYVELMLTLPATWHIDKDSFRNEVWYWPFRLLKELALLPHKHATWLGWGHTIPNGDPPRPYAPNTKLCGALVMPSLLVPRDFHTLQINQEKEIFFFAVYPLYAEEMELKMRSGLDALLERFDQAKIKDLIDIGRENVARKRFGLF
jgi:hypothetical protein